IAIRTPATIRLTEALIRSKAGASWPFELLLSSAGFANCKLIFSCIDLGKIRFTPFAALVDKRTTSLDKRFGLNFSFPSDCLDKPISVSVTDFAFLEKQRVSTIIAPAINNNTGSVGTFSAKEPMAN